MVVNINLNVRHIAQDIDRTKQRTDPRFGFKLLSAGLAKLQTQLSGRRSITSPSSTTLLPSTPE